jgi:uncharacterized Zn finger protein
MNWVSLRASSLGSVHTIPNVLHVLGSRWEDSYCLLSHHAKLHCQAMPTQAGAASGGVEDEDQVTAELVNCILDKEQADDLKTILEEDKHELQEISATMDKNEDADELFAVEQHFEETAAPSTPQLDPTEGMGARPKH